MYFIDAIVEGVSVSEVNSQIDFAFTRYQDILDEIKDLDIEGDFAILYELDDTFVCDLLSDFVNYGATDITFVDLKDFEGSILAEFRSSNARKIYTEPRNVCKI